VQVRKSGQQEKKAADQVSTLSLQERIDRVKPLWSSLSSEERASFLTVSVKELAKYAADADNESNDTADLALVGAFPTWRR
jgi:hypothetical protein